MARIALTAHALPQLLREIAEVTSLETAERLARHWGGQRKSIPRRLGAEHELARLVGLFHAGRICRLIGGEQVDIPSASVILTALDAQRLADQGRSHAEIAAKLGRSVRHIRRILAGYEPPPAEPAAVPSAPIRCPTCGKRHDAAYHRPRATAPGQLELPLG